MRQELFLNNSKSRWTNGSDFLASLKICLAQIYADDDSDIDALKMKKLCSDTAAYCKEGFFNGGKLLSSLKFSLTVTLGEASFPFSVDQSSVSLVKKREEESKEPFGSYLLADEFSRQVKSYSLIEHDEWTEAYLALIKEFFTQRLFFTLDHFSAVVKQTDEKHDASYAL